MSIEALRSQIDAEALKLGTLLSQRRDLDRQIYGAKERLEAFQQAFALVTGEPVPAETFLQDGAFVTPKGVVRPTINHTDPWQDALIQMKAKGGEFTTNEIVAEAKRRGIDIPRLRARSRLAHLVDKKVLLRVREGVFRFSPQGGDVPDLLMDEHLLKLAQSLAWRDDEEPPDKG
jgi:hypothetical protein